MAATRSGAAVSYFERTSPFDPKPRPRVPDDAQFEPMDDEPEPEDYSGDDPYHPCRDSGLPSLEDIAAWESLR